MLRLLFIFMWFKARATSLPPTVVVVAGGTNSGKTHLSRALVERLGPGRAARLALDNYYFPYERRDLYLRDGVENFDHPDTIDFERLNADLARLRAGEPITIQEATYTAHGDELREVTILPRPFLILEGLHVLDPRLRAEVSLRVVVEAPRELRRRRRVSRDVPKGFSVAEVEDYFDRVAEPMHERFVRPSAARADVMVTSSDDPVETARVIEDLTDRLERIRCEAELGRPSAGPAPRPKPI